MANGELELTPEELEAYRAVASTFSPGMREVLRPPPVEAPPVPLPLGTERLFVARPAPPIEPLETMRKQINDIDFKTKQEAVQVATRFEALRAYHQDLAAGKDPTRWLATIFEKNPSAIAGQMRELRLARPPAAPKLHSLTNTAGDVVPFVTYNNRGQIVPRSALPAAPLSTNVTEHMIPGTTNVLARSIPSGPQSRRFFEAEKAKPAMTQAQELSALHRLIASGEKELEGIGTTIGAFEDPSIEKEKDRKAAAKPLFDAAQKRREALKADIDGWREQVKARTPGAAGESATKPAEKTVQSQADADMLLEKANKAIAGGADRAAVRKWLESKGVTVKE